MARGFGHQDIPDLSGKTLVVTGANSGIGFEAVRALARKGAHLVMACRNLEKGRTAADVIRKETPAASLELRTLDLGSLRSVRVFAEDVNKAHQHIDVLINNAGVMAIPRRETEDGFEMQLGTNHLGHFALTGLLSGRLLETKGARVVSVSSMAHDWGKMDFEDLFMQRRYTKWGAYGQSKLANLLFAYELQRRLEVMGAEASSIACHPGYAATNLQFVAPEMTGSKVEKAIMSIGNALFAQSAEGGALPTVYAATSPDAAGGDFIGPRFLRIAGAPEKQHSNRRSRSLEDAKKLWDVSATLTGVGFEALRAETSPASTRTG